ncbi:MAG TPA: hypothetical protein VLA14_07665 [Polyangia bacterium]|jgi:hypothetical protein|nr:hypothetical protein [Polyangia bacterium]
MATIQFGETNFVIQAAETEVTWTVSWGLQRDEWFNFQIAPDFSDSPDDDWIPTAVEITRQVVTVSAVYPYEVQTQLTVRNLSAAGSEVVLGFCGMKSSG